MDMRFLALDDLANQTHNNVFKIMCLLGLTATSRKEIHIDTYFESWTFFDLKPCQVHVDRKKNIHFCERWDNLSLFNILLIINKTDPKVQ